MDEQRKNNTQGNGQRISVRPGNFAPPPKKHGGRPPVIGGQLPAGGASAGSTQNGGTQGGNAQGNAQGGGSPHRRRPHDRRGPRPERPQGAEGQSGADKAARPAQPGGAPTERQRNDRRNSNHGNGNGSNGADRNAAGNNSGSNAGKPRGNEPQRQRQPQGEARQGTQGGQGKRGKGRRQEHTGRTQKNGAPALSASLQRELDEEFSTPMLTSFTSSQPSARKKEAEVVEDTSEFEVDIATAAYLIEDIPSGVPAPGVKSVEVVGVRFRRAGKIYFFTPNGLKFSIGDSAIVDTARGPELGEIVMLNRRIAEKHIVQPLRAVLRRATPEDLERNAENRRQEKEALRICAEKIAAHKLDMRLVDAQYAFDNSKLLFYFTSDGRVDFRDLVRDLAGVFHTRIELRQIGIRDEARLIGGLGMCGRPFCCATFLSDFGQVSVKMAKEQGLSINTSKISGCCGRLMCCLRYEHETYQAEARLTPKKDTRVLTPDGPGVVVDSTPISGLLRVRLSDSGEENAVRVYHRDDVTVESARASGTQRSGDGKDTTLAENAAPATATATAEAPEPAEDTAPIAPATEAEGAVPEVSGQEN